MDPAQGTLFAIDNDPTARRALTASASSLGIKCELFSTAEEFLDYYDPALAGCVLVNLRLPGMDGLQLHEHLAALGSILPVILLSAAADVSLVVRAMKQGALAFLQIPYQEPELIDTIRKALDLNARVRESLAFQADVQRCLETLTPREHHLMELVIAGVPNKRIAYILELSPRTVDRVRASVFRKMRVKSAVELANIVVKSQISVMQPVNLQFQ